MAIYHLSVKAVQRSKGQSAIAGAAYRAAARLVDHQTGQIHDYGKKRGVALAEIVVPEGCDWRPTREELWNAAEAAEKRKDATLAREHVVAIPVELPQKLLLSMVRGYAIDLAKRHGCAVDFAIHAPSAQGDQRNWHAHVYQTTRKVEGAGLGGKCDREKAGRKRSEDLAFERERWARFCNKALEMAGSVARVDHRSLAEQGIDRAPSWHRGPAVTAMTRRGVVTDHQSRFDAAVADSAAAATALDQEIEALQQELDESVWQLEQDELVTGAAFERGLAAFVAAQPQQAEPEMFTPSLETLKAARRDAETAQDAPEAGEAWQPSLETLKAAQKAVAKPEPAKPKPPEKDVGDWDMDM